jgi:putative RNA 2'-phosphotransferase
LRHRPERIGLELGPGGWVEVDALLGACARQRFPISRVELAVDASAMRRDGWEFYRSGNGVWLVEHVPPRYLSRRPEV